MMDDPRETLTFVSPYPIEVAKQRLDEKSSPRKKIYVNQPFQFDVRTEIQDMDTVHFMMAFARIERGRGLLNVILLRNYEKAIQHGEETFGKIQGTLQRQPDNTTLVTTAFYWNWEDFSETESALMMRKMVFLTTIGVAILSIGLAIDEQNIAPIFWCNVCWGVWVGLMPLLMSFEQSTNHRYLMKTLKKTLGYRGQ